MGIVLPDGILGNSGDEYIRRWILCHTWVLASIDLPVEAFIVEANVNILTSLLFLKKKPQSVVQAEDLGQREDYPVFMAVAEKVGFDRRGDTLYKRSPDGEEILENVEEVERIRTNGHFVERRLRRKKKVLDDDLPLIADARGAGDKGPIEPLIVPDGVALTSSAPAEAGGGSGAEHPDQKRYALSCRFLRLTQSSRQ